MTSGRLKIIVSAFIITLTATSLVGCGGVFGKSDSVEIRVSTTDIFAKRFVLTIGTNESVGLTSVGDSLEIDVSDNWTQGTKIPFYVETSYVPDKDPILNSMVGDWSVGELTLTGSNWDVPLLLHIGEATIWSEEGSWAQVSKSPRSEKFETLDKLNFENQKLKLKITAIERKFRDIRNRQNNSMSPGLCSEDFMVVKTFDDFGVWATSCWAEYETVHIPQWTKFLGERASANAEDLIQKVAESLDRLSRDFRSNVYINSNSDFKQAAIEFQVSSQKLFTSIASLIGELHAREKEIQKSLKRLTKEINDKSDQAP
jgi:hypothetical protein